MLFVSRIGGFVGVEGVVESNSRSLKVIGDRRIIVLMMLCAFSAMNSPEQN